MAMLPKLAGASATGAGTLGAYNVANNLVEQMQKAKEEGMWVREAAMAFAAKRASKKTA
jgi:hypothetical protein